MTDRMKEEKREFVRADFSIETSIRLVDKDEFDPKHSLRRMFDSNRPADPNGPISKRSDLSDTAVSALWEFLIQINEKLDRIINILSDDIEVENRIEVKETLNISGSGVSMVLTQSVEIGQLLDISLNIPDFPMGVFRIQGEVMRISPYEGIEAGLFEVGIKFLNISDDEREGLIAYTFRQQRRTIRQLKDSN